MEKQTLRAQLEELHAALKQTGPLDNAEREMLRQLAADVRAALDREDEPPQHLTGLSSKLKDALAQTEASHPRVTMLMRSVIDQIAFMGI